VLQPRLAPRHYHPRQREQCHRQTRPDPCRGSPGVQQGCHQRHGTDGDKDDALQDAQGARLQPLTVLEIQAEGDETRADRADGSEKNPGIEGEARHQAGNSSGSGHYTERRRQMREADRGRCFAPSVSADIARYGVRGAGASIMPGT